VYSLEVDGTVSASCLLAGFGISGVELSSSAATIPVSQ